MNENDKKIEEIKMAMDSAWRCDSLDHNEPDGCSNPECFKHDPPHPMWKEFEESFDNAWKNLTAKKLYQETE